MNTTLITGADGCLGERITRQYLAKTDARLILWLKANDEESAKSKRDRLAARLPDVLGSRVQLAFGDLNAADPFADIDPQSISHIVHSAAVVRFNVDESTAQNVNIDGTRKVVEFAHKCNHLKRLGYLSTVYAFGMTPGTLLEVPIPNPPGFANYYEWSKWTAEQYLLAQRDDLPVTIMRLSTVIAEDSNGTVSKNNAVHNTLQLLYYGLISLVPGVPSTPVYLVTAQFVADAVEQLMRAAEPGIYHIAHQAKDSLTLGELLDIAYETFLESENFKKRRILRPLLVDLPSFEMLSSEVNNFGGAVLNQSLGSVTPFAKQLFCEKRIDNSRLIQALGDYVPDDSAVLFKETCRYLYQKRWQQRSAATSVKSSAEA